MNQKPSIFYTKCHKYVTEEPKMMLQHWMENIELRTKNGRNNNI